LKAGLALQVLFLLSPRAYVEGTQVEDVNLIGGAALWLRNSWGYFWKEI